jgi:hypothetical protein
MGYAKEAPQRELGITGKQVACGCSIGCEAKARRAKTDSRPCHHRPQLIDVAHLGRSHEGFVFLQNHDLGVPPDVEVALGKVSLQFVIGGAPEPAELGVIIELKVIEAVGLEHDARWQIAEAGADHGYEFVPR